MEQISGALPQHNQYCNLLKVCCACPSCIMMVFTLPQPYHERSKLPPSARAACRATSLATIWSSALSVSQPLNNNKMSPITLRTALRSASCAPRVAQLTQCRYKSGPYGYTQAKALVYSKYGEPKDVLSYVTTSSIQWSSIEPTLNMRQSEANSSAACITTLSPLLYRKTRSSSAPLLRL